MESKESDSMLPCEDPVTLSPTSPKEDDSSDIQHLQQNIEAISKQRNYTLVDRHLTRSLSDTRKYDKYNHMGDVVDEVLTRTGVTLQEISRLNESYIDSAERTAYGTLQKVNDYRVLAELAKGSFGTVYLVEDDRRKRYAMKAFPFIKAKKTLARGRAPPGTSSSSSSNENIDLIRREIALMKKLIHPYIVRLFEVVEERIYPHSIYLILEYINGGPIMILSKLPSSASLASSPRGIPVPALAKDLSVSSTTSEHAMSNYPPQWESSLTGGVLGEALASKLFRQLISAMQYLHLNAVAHRDLKPENILVTLDGDIKVVDFGVSQDFGGESGGSSGFVRDTKGSWPFWAPEMIDNHSANAYSAYSADVWAAGVCLWIFVFGSLPFWAPGPSHLPDPIFDEILACKNSPPTFPSRKSPELCELLLSIFTVSPEERPTFQDLLRFDWIQQHTAEDIEKRLNEISSVSVDCSELLLDAKTAVTPGEVNFLSDNAKRFFVKMAQRIRQKVRDRHEQLLVAKDEEIETKREEMRHYDPIPSPPSASHPAASSSSSAASVPPLPPPLSAAVAAPTVAQEPTPTEFKIESHPQQQLQVSSVRGTAAGVSAGVGLGREFSKQSNWTSQTELVAAAGVGSASHQQIEETEEQDKKEETTKEEKKNSSSCCCIVQ